jgi:hypothetical protein
MAPFHSLQAAALTANIHDLHSDLVLEIEQRKYQRVLENTKATKKHEHSCSFQNCCNSTAVIVNTCRNKKKRFISIESRGA